MEKGWLYNLHRIVTVCYKQAYFYTILKRNAANNGKRMYLFVLTFIYICKENNIFSTDCIFFGDVAALNNAVIP